MLIPGNLCPVTKEFLNVRTYPRSFYGNDCECRTEGANRRLKSASKKNRIAWDLLETDDQPHKLQACTYILATAGVVRHTNFHGTELVMLVYAYLRIGRNVNRETNSPFNII